MALQAQLDALSSQMLTHLRQRGFDRDRLLGWASEMHLGQASRNLLRGTLAPVPLSSMAQLPVTDSNEYAWLRRVGEEAIARGELAVCVLAGGMATRMGGVVKALVELAPGFTFLDVALGERRVIREQLGRAPSLWLMTSQPTNGPIRAALKERGDPTDVNTFEQFVSLRLTEEGDLFIDEEAATDGQPCEQRASEQPASTGLPSVYATGHGDLPDALRASGLLETFVSRGGRYVWISNLDNLGARVDPAILGQHIESAAPLTVEVVDKIPGDTGGGPVTLDGKAIIAEHFRVPSSFDMNAVPVFNTNTFIVDAQKLATFELAWTYVEVRKRVQTSQQERVAVQFERLLGEMTMAIPPRMQRVSRAGEASRFLGMKTHADMDRERSMIAKLADRLSATSRGL